MTGTPSGVIVGYPVEKRTREIPKPAMDLLRKHCDVEVNPDDQILDYNILLDKVKGRDAVLTLLTDKIDKRVIDAADRAKIIANYAVGFDNIDFEYAREKDIDVTNTPDVLTDSTADLAWALIFATMRRVVEADKFTRAGKYKGWGPMLFLGQEVTGKTLGVFGCGRIGANFVQKAQGFNMKILYHDVTPKPEFEKMTGAIYADKETLLKESDIISLHVPLLPQTYHLISWDELKLMKKSAVLINTARGPIIDEKALVRALKEKEIWGASLDVYENELALEPGLAELDNVVLFPHIASATIETRTNMGMIAIKNILAAMSGEPLLTPVNKG